MNLLDILLAGGTLGGLYALTALGLSLQYGVARIMNLSYGEFLIAPAFLAFFGVSLFGLPPWLLLLAALPLGFGLQWLIYRWLLSPLVRRTGAGPALEVDSILLTFGFLFVVQGLMLALFTGNYYSYSYLATPVHLLGSIVAANRLLVMLAALLLGLGIYALLTHSAIGRQLRAVASAPQFAHLVGLDVARLSALAFALGGALAAGAGVLLSMFLPFSASMGSMLAMKALIVVIMGGVGNLLGCLLAGLMLGLIETMVASWLDPGLTLAANYTLFLLVLLLRPRGLFARPA